MGVAFKVEPTRPDEPDAGYGAERGTSTKRDHEPRVPLIGVDAGCTPGTKPGSSVKRLEKELRDVREAQRAAQKLNDKARSVVRKQVSASGILRTRRTTV